MHTTGSSSHWGVSTRHPPQDQHPPSPPGADPLEADTPPEQTPPGAHMPWEQTPPEQAPPCGQNSWHMLVKILPCPKLHLSVVKIILHAPVYNNAVTTEAARPSLI